MVEFSGRCLCGAVKWRSTAAPTRSLVCHCESCQRATSSAYAAFVGFAPDCVEWRGEINHFESSAGTHRGFCPTCGSRLYFKSAKWRGEIHVHAGTLDDPSLYAPDKHVVWSEHAPWLEKVADLPISDSFDASPKME